MNIPDEEVANASVNPHCIRYWPHADQAPGVLGHHIANAIEAICGASTAASLLQSDQFLRDAHALEESSEAPALVDANTRAGLFSALHTCLNAASAAVDRAYRVARRGVEDAP